MQKVSPKQNSYRVPKLKTIKASWNKWHMHKRIAVLLHVGLPILIFGPVDQDRMMPRRHEGNWRFSSVAAAADNK